jgi:hypothetical protein
VCVCVCVCVVCFVRVRVRVFIFLCSCMQAREMEDCFSAVVSNPCVEVDGMLRVHRYVPPEAPHCCRLRQCPVNMCKVRTDCCCCWPADHRA